MRGGMRTEIEESHVAPLDANHVVVTHPCVEREIDFFQVLEVPVKYWKILLLVPFMFAFVTAIYTLLMPDVYTAKTLILPTEEDSSGMMATMMSQMGGLASLAGGLAGGSSKAEVYVTMLRSETIKGPIVDRFNLMDLYKSKHRATAYSALDACSTISVGKKDGIISILVDNPDPKLAAAIANAYVDELGKSAMQLSMQGAGRNRSFLEERLAKAKGDLAAAENALKFFQLKNKTVEINEQSKATLERIARLRAELIAKDVELAALRLRFTDANQEVKSAKTTVGKLREEISNLEGNDAKGAMPSLGVLPQLGQEYGRLMREFTVQETLVELLTKQNEVAKLNEAKDIIPFQVLQRASVPELKSKPKRAIIVIMAAITGGVVALLAAFVYEFFKRMDDQQRRRWRDLLIYFQIKKV